MDLRAAVALSLRPRLSRRALTNEFREALRRDEAPAGQADVTLDTLHQRLGYNEPGRRAAIRRARGLAERALGLGRVVGVEPIPCLLGLELKGLVARAGGGRFVRSSGRW